MIKYLKKMANIFLNGTKVTQSNNVVVNGSIVAGDDSSICINGVRYTTGLKVEIKVEGNVDNIELAQGNVEVSGNSGDINVSQGNVTVKGNVSGSIDISQGDIHCQDIDGDIDISQGDVRCRTHTRNTRA